MMLCSKVSNTFLLLTCCFKLSCMNSWMLVIIYIPFNGFPFPSKNVGLKKMWYLDRIHLIYKTVTFTCEKRISVIRMQKEDVKLETRWRQIKSFVNEFRLLFVSFIKDISIICLNVFSNWTHVMTQKVSGFFRINCWANLN
jgi:hypothetical protein